MSLFGVAGKPDARFNYVHIAHACYISHGTIASITTCSLSGITHSVAGEVGARLQVVAVVNSNHQSACKGCERHREPAEHFCFYVIDALL